MRDAIGLVVGWFVIIKFAKEGCKLIEYNIDGCMSDILVSGKKIYITMYVISDDIDGIRDPRYHMRHRTIFLTC